MLTDTLAASTLKTISASMACVAICLNAAYATDIRMIDPGDTLYIDGGITGNDEKVYVVRVLHDSGQVKIRRQNGDVSLVRASDLYTREEMDKKNMDRRIGGAVGAGLFLYCVMGGCKKE